MVSVLSLSPHVWLVWHTNPDLVCIEVSDAAIRFALPAFKVSQLVSDLVGMRGVQGFVATFQMPKWVRFKKV